MFFKLSNKEMRNYILIILLFLSQITFAQFSANQKSISGYTFFDFQNRNVKNFNYLTSDTVKIQRANNKSTGFTLGLGKGKFVSEKKLKTWAVYYNYNSSFELTESYDSLEINRIYYNQNLSIDHTFSIRNLTTNFVSIKPKFGFLWSYSYSVRLKLSKIESESNNSLPVIYTNKSPSVGVNADFNAGLWYKINDRFFVQTSFNLLSANLTYTNISNSSLANASTSNISLGINGISSINMIPETISFGLTYILKP
jgi:hypothetical protein